MTHLPAKSSTSLSSRHLALLLVTSIIALYNTSRHHIVIIMSTTPFLKLPTELLLEIISHLPYLPRDRRKNLLVLTKVCKFFNQLVSPILYTSPYVRISRTRRLVDSYLAQPDLARKVRSLELYEVEDRNALGQGADREVGEPAGAIKSNKPLRKMYTSLIRATGISEAAQKSWQEDILQENPKVWVGLLLAALPSLECLLLGGVSVAYLERVDRLGAVTTPKLSSSPSYGYEPPEPQSYLADMLMAMGPKLRKLELPYEASDYPSQLDYTWNRSWPAISCRALTSLTAHMDALEGFYLPLTLQEMHVKCLQLSDVNTLLRRITHEEHMGQLRNLYIYTESHEAAVKDGTYHPYCVTDSELNEVASLMTRAMHQGIQANLLYTNQCCYFYSCLRGMIEEAGFTGYSDRDLRVLEVRGALRHLEPEAKRRETLLREKQAKERRREERKREQRHQERREQGERSDMSESDYCQAGIWD
jgi:hypothetical protein